MATIVSKQRANGLVYYIVYKHIEEDRKRKQKWIRCNSLHDARLLLPEVEDYERRNLIYPIPQENQRYRIAAKAKKAPAEIGAEITVRQLIMEYMEHRCKNGFWEAATCQYNESLSKNYIFPYIGDYLIIKIQPRDLQLFYNDLPNHEAVRQKKRIRSQKSPSVQFGKFISSSVPLLHMRSISVISSTIRRMIWNSRSWNRKSGRNGRRKK